MPQNQGSEMLRNFTKSNPAEVQGQVLNLGLTSKPMFSSNVIGGLYNYSLFKIYPITRPIYFFNLLW